jgi:spore maturation protein CgeB
MKILIYEWKSFGIEDVCEALTNMSHTYKVVSDEELQSRVSAGFDERFEKEISDGYDCVFTFNYSPVLSNNCKKHDIPYIAFVYDSPQVLLYSYTLINPCNYVFIFDKQQFMEFKKNGINTVYYAPLAANPKRLAKQIKDVKASTLADFFKSDISFVGSMYNEKHNLFDRFKDLPPYVSGYLDAIMQAQMKVYGYYFLDKLLSSDIIRELQKSVPLEPNKDGVETIQYLYSEYFLSRKMACMERHELLGKLSEQFNVNLFTHNPTPELPKITNKGAIDYYIDMPSVFGCSKINLNITLRSIKSGIPLRCMDIMGAGGFLLSNFQEDFYDFFVPGEDCVLYDSQEDCVEKCRYYLEHDSEREQIAANGLGKVTEAHTYEIRLKEMFDIVFNR